jgi:hypothetical protein
VTPNRHGAAVREYPTLAFRDAPAGRAHMTKSDGQDDSFKKLEEYVTSLLEQS